MSGRLQAEKKHQTTEILLDALSLDQWVLQLGPQGEQLPNRLLEQGISSLAFAELHLDTLTEKGTLLAQTSPEFRLTLASGAMGSPDNEEITAAEEFAALHPEGTYLLFAESARAQAMLGQLRVLFGEQTQLLLNDRVIWVMHNQRTLKSLGLGFDIPRITQFAEAGFSIWLRPENRAGLTEEQTKALFSVWKGIPQVQGVIFGGGLNEAMGYPRPELLSQTGQLLKDHSWKIGYIELPGRSQQKGIETLVRAHPDLVVRVMAVGPAHQAKLSPFRVLGMYSLGSRERNIRVLYVRPFAVPGRPELDEEFLFSLSAELENGGQASVFQPETLPPPGYLSTILMSLAAGALAVLILVNSGLPYQAWWPALFVLPVLLGLAGMLIHKAILIRSLLALCIAVGGPVFGCLKFVYPALCDEKQNSLVGGLKCLVLTSLVSLSAGLFVAALLTDTTFLLGLDRFRGVKLLTLGTPLLIVFAFLLKHYSLSQWLDGLRANIVVYQAVLAGAMALVFGLLYLRTGNNAGGAASESERTLRVVLDRVLGVRPRFKEFMLAHPAMVVSPFFAAKTGFLPSLVLIVLAGVGQAGIVDTFAHVHTPLDVTLIRIGLGVGLGALVGVGGFGVCRLVEPLVSKVRVTDE